MTPDAKTRAAMVEAAMDIHYGADVWRDFEEGYIAQARSRVYAALTAAILAMEARGYKVTGPEATEAQIAALRAGAESEADDWARAHAAAPGWGDGK